MRLREDRTEDYEHWNTMETVEHCRFSIKIKHSYFAKFAPKSFYHRHREDKIPESNRLRSLCLALCGPHDTLLVFEHGFALGKEDGKVSYINELASSPNLPR